VTQPVIQEEVPVPEKVQPLIENVGEWVVEQEVVAPIEPEVEPKEVVPVES